MVTKKLNKSTRVRKLLEHSVLTADQIAKKVGCSTQLVGQIDRKMRAESDQKVRDAYLDKVELKELIAKAKPFPIEPPLFEKVGGNPVPDFLKQKADPINPSHYQQGDIEVIDVIEAYQLNYRLGNVVKYVLRHLQKSNPLEDLKKARWYLDREIKKYE